MPRITELKFSESAPMPRITESSRPIMIRSSPSVSSDSSQDTDLAESFTTLADLDEIIFEEHADAIDLLRLRENDDKNCDVGNQDKQLNYFNVSVHDMDSGLIHNLEGVKCIQIRHDR